MKFPYCHHSLLLQKYHQREGVLGEKSRAYESCLGLPYLIVQCQQLIFFLRLFRRWLRKLVQDILLCNEWKWHNQYHADNSFFLKQEHLSQTAYWEQFGATNASCLGKHWFQERLVKAVSRWVFKRKMILAFAGQ